MSDTNHYGSWQLQHEFIESYGTFYASLLNDVLGLLDGVSNRTKTIHEARIEAIARFRSVMEENLPACHKTVAAYRAGVAEQEAEEAKRRVENMERQERIREAEAKFQKESIERADRAHRIAKETEERESKEHRQQFDAAQRALQAEKDRNEAEQAAELERRLLAAVDGDAE
jgi:hypothetical protein